VILLPRLLTLPRRRADLPLDLLYTVALHLAVVPFTLQRSVAPLRVVPPLRFIRLLRTPALPYRFGRVAGTLPHDYAAL